MDDARYLEIGVWAGSSSCAAMFGNKAYCVFMDDWSGFGGPKDKFLENFNKFKGDNNAEFIEADCFNHQEEFGTKFNIYLFDGDHSAQSHYQAIKDYLRQMDDVFVYIVDDYNFNEVRQGTQRAINELGLTTVWKKEVRLTNDDQFTHDQEEAKNTYWNGVCVFIFKK